MKITEEQGKTIIDFSKEEEIKENKEGQVNEFLDPYSHFGYIVKNLLSMIFRGETSAPVSIKGTPLQIKSFIDTLGKEKNFMSAWRKYGVEDPKTARTKGALQSSMNKFQRSTGIEWPFKF